MTTNTKHDLAETPSSARTPDAVVSFRDVLGIRVAAATADVMRAHIEQRLDAEERLAVAFLNAHGSNVAARTPEFRAALDGMLVLNDGIGVDIAARVLYGDAFPANLNGTDFVPYFLAATATQHRIYLLGGRSGVAQRAAAAVARLAPHHEIAGTRDGYFAADEVAPLLADIRRTGADLLLVALGNPAQELFLARHFARSGCRLAFGVGALFDFLAGEVPRAPPVLRRARLEWAYRLSIEPRRLWRRYLVGNARFLTRVALARLARRAQRA